MSWIPSKKEKKYLKLVISMTTDCLLGNGTVDISTYVTNLEKISKQLNRKKVKKE